MTRLNLVFLVSTLRRSGPTGQLLNIVRYLDRARFAPHVVTLSPEPQWSMSAAFDALDVQVKSLRLTRLRGAFHRTWRDEIERLLGMPLTHAAVVHSHGIRPDLICARHLRGVKSIATARNYPYHDYVMKYGRIVGSLMAWSHLRGMRKLPNVVACSGTVAGLLGRHGVASVVIRDGVSTDEFAPALPAARMQLRARLGLPPDACVGVCVGTLSARKDPLTVVRAMRRIRESNVAIVFAGSGALEGRCRGEAGGDDRIRFVGQVDNVVEYLQAADFLVSASRSEGLPNAVLEALACGLPVVLSDIDPHREALGLAPDAGELFAAGDQGALAAVIERTATRPRRADADMLVQARDLIGAERMSRAYQELYARVAGDEGDGRPE